MALLGFLIAFPLLVAIALMAFRKDSVRDPLVIGSAVVIGVASVACAVTFMGNPSTFAMTPEMSLAGNYVAVAVDLFLCGLVFALSIAYRNGVMFAMSFVQLLVSIWCGSFALHPEDAMAEPMYIDNLSVTRKTKRNAAKVNATLRFILQILFKTVAVTFARRRF